MKGIQRSSASWRARLNDSKSSARGTALAVKTAAPVGLTAVPDRKRRLSDGFLVEASILARVLGIRLLTLDATVVLVPADVTAPSSEPPDLPESRTARSLDSAPARPSGLAVGQAGAVGSGLADAVRSINEGAALLAEARRNGS